MSAQETHSLPDSQLPSGQEGNTLFPVFLKLDKLQLVIVGGGYVGTEKLRAVLTNSPKANVRLVAATICDEVKALAATAANVQLIEKLYDASDLAGADLVIAALNDRSVSGLVMEDAKAAKILVNVADQPERCDFYLSSVVKKGNLKVAISTNGKSPTVAKRIRALLEDILPEELDELLDNMQQIRNSIKGDFEEKVKQLNAITQTLTKSASE